MLFERMTGLAVVAHLDFFPAFLRREIRQRIRSMHRVTVLLLHWIALSDSLHIVILLLHVKCQTHTSLLTWLKRHLWEDLPRLSPCSCPSEHSFFINVLSPQCKGLIPVCPLHSPHSQYYQYRDLLEKRGCPLLMNIPFEYSYKKISQ